MSKELSFKKLPNTSGVNHNAVSRKSIETICEEVKQYAITERKLSDAYITTSTRAIKTIIKRYSTKYPTPELAKKVEIDMRERGLSAHTIKFYLYSLELWAASQNIQLKIKKPKPPKKEVEYLTPDECLSLVNACGTYRDRAVIWVLIGCGLRNKEIRHLRVQDVDFNKKYIYIRDRGQHIKNNEETIAIIPCKECEVAIREWIEERMGMNLQHDILFPSREGGMFTQGGFRILINRIGKKAGLKTFPHKLRHSCATAMAAAGYSPTAIGLQLHQKDIRSTLRYIHYNHEMLKKNMDERPYF